MSSDFGDSYGAEQIRRRSSALRRLIKSRYIQNLVRVFDGPTIDLGCGAGQVLERLPSGSVGLEINDTLIGYLKALQLNVLKYDALADDFALTPLSGQGPGRYHHLLSAHVLEHFDDPVHAVRRLAASCDALGVQSMTFVVPGEKGFSSDPTHRVFVTEAFIRQQGLADCGPFHLDSVSYFPLNWRGMGKWFTYHECILTWRRR